MKYSIGYLANRCYIMHFSPVQQKDVFQELVPLELTEVGSRLDLSSELKQDR